MSEDHEENFSFYVPEGNLLDESPEFRRLAGMWLDYLDILDGKKELYSELREEMRKKMDSIRSMADQLAETGIELTSDDYYNGSLLAATKIRLARLGLKPEGAAEGAANE